METRKRKVRPGLVLVALLGAAWPAHANPEYPPIVQDVLGMPCVPQCTICHRDLLGGRTTLRTTVNGAPGFGLNLYEQEGLRALLDQGPSLQEILNRPSTAAHDVDGDTIPDVQELALGEDPNDPSNAVNLCGIETPEYGCFARVAPTTPAARDGAGGAAAVVAVLSLAMLARRRRG